MSTSGYFSGEHARIIQLLPCTSPFSKVYADKDDPQGFHTQPVIMWALVECFEFDALDFANYAVAGDESVHECFRYSKIVGLALSDLHDLDPVDEVANFIRYEPGLEDSWDDATQAQMRQLAIELEQQQQLERERERRKPALPSG